MGEQREGKHRGRKDMKEGEECRIGRSTRKKTMVSARLYWGTDDDIRNEKDRSERGGSTSKHEGGIRVGKEAKRLPDGTPREAVEVLIRNAGDHLRSSTPSLPSLSSSLFSHYVPRLVLSFAFLSFSLLLNPFFSSSRSVFHIPAVFLFHVSCLIHLNCQILFIFLVINFMLY